jgi:hypothetical protein
MQLAMAREFAREALRARERSPQEVRQCAINAGGIVGTRRERDLRDEGTG